MASSCSKETKESRRCFLCSQENSVSSQPVLVNPPFLLIANNNSLEENKAESSVDSSRKDGAELIDLPSDLMANILSRLPIKTLLQCRTVITDWNHLTRIPQFIKLHHLNGQPLTFAFASFKRRVGLNDLFVFGKDGDDTVRIPFNPELQGMSYIVSHSCNGFLLLQAIGNLTRTGAGTSTGHHAKQQNIPDFVIYNPITKETIVDIPKPPQDSLPRVSFAFDAKTQKYKLVLEFSYIITIGETSWRKLSGPLHGRFGAPVFFNGAIYWIHCCNEVIISLDICTEKYRIVGRPLQGLPIGRHDDCYLVEHDNKLVFIVFDCESQEMQSWSLLDDGQQYNWVYQSKFSMGNFFSKYYCDQHMYKIKGPVGNNSLLLYHHNDDRDLKYGLIDTWWKRAFIYTPKLGGHVVNFITNYLECWADFQVLHFIPNLASFYNSN